MFFYGISPSSCAVKGLLSLTCCNWKLQLDQYLMGWEHPFVKITGAVLNDSKELLPQNKSLDTKVNYYAILWSRVQDE